MSGLHRISGFTLGLTLLAMTPAWVSTQFTETFENKTSVTQTQLFVIPGSTNVAVGNENLVLPPDSAVNVPVTLGSSYELHFVVERPSGSGVFLVDPDRDGQHGFDRVMTISGSGKLHFHGMDTGLELGTSGTHDVTLCWTETGTGTPGTWTLKIVNQGNTYNFATVPTMPCTVPPGMNFGHVGPGSADILVHEIHWISQGQ